MVDQSRRRCSDKVRSQQGGTSGCLTRGEQLSLLVPPEIGLAREGAELSAQGILKPSLAQKAVVRGQFGNSGS